MGKNDVKVIGMDVSKANQDEAVLTLHTQDGVETVAIVPKPYDGATEGRIVHYILEDGPNPGRHIAAMIVRKWGDGNCCNLVLFADGSNDGNRFGTVPIAWVTSRMYADPAKAEKGTWHWPERV